MVADGLSTIFVRSYAAHQFWIVFPRMLISHLGKLLCLIKSEIESLDSKPAHQEYKLGMYIVYWEESKTVYTNIYNSSLPMASLCPKTKSNTKRYLTNAGTPYAKVESRSHRHQITSLNGITCNTSFVYTSW